MGDPDLDDYTGGNSLSSPVASLRGDALQSSDVHVQLLSPMLAGGSPAAESVDSVRSIGATRAQLSEAEEEDGYVVDFETDVPDDLAGGQRLGELFPGL